eukprot:SAG31_NODE_2870_length_4974_cov_1.507282_5_plen_239_part_00
MDRERELWKAALQERFSWFPAPAPLSPLDMIHANKKKPDTLGVAIPLLRTVLARSLAPPRSFQQEYVGSLVELTLSADLQSISIVFKLRPPPGTEGADLDASACSASVTVGVGEPIISIDWVRCMFFPLPWGIAAIVILMPSCRSSRPLPLRLPSAKWTEQSAAATTAVGAATLLAGACGTRLCSTPRQLFSSLPTHPAQPRGDTERQWRFRRKRTRKLHCCGARQLCYECAHARCAG